MVFSVDLSASQIIGITGYTWTVSAGTIESGQGTQSIAVRTTPADQGSNVTATVTAQGVPTGCTNTASETAGITPACGLPIDQYGKIPWKYEVFHLDNIQIQLEQNPGYRLFINLMIGSDESFDTARKHAKKMIKHFLWRDKGFDLSRVAFVMWVEDEHSTVFDLGIAGSKSSLCQTGCVEIPGSDLVK